MEKLKTQNGKTGFNRIGVGRKKIAPINMKKEEHQFVIDAYLVDEVLSQIPADIKIIQACIYCIKREKNHRIIVSNALRKEGCSSAYLQGECVRYQLIFDQTTKSVIRSKYEKICELTGADRRYSYFRYLVLANKNGNVKFEHTTKEIKPDETDLRKKLRVLGATTGSGQVQSVISDLNAKKYRCSIKEEPVKFVMCYRD
jgi:HrpA-like RNA helicase